MSETTSEAMNDEANATAEPRTEIRTDPQPRLASGSIELVRSLEKFSVAALPARTSWELPGWLCLADDGGRVGRANSATAMPNQEPAAEPATVSEVAASYRERGLPPLLRWTPDAPATTASQLAELGWGSAGEVLVMVRAVAGSEGSATGPSRERPGTGAAGDHEGDDAVDPRAPNRFDIELAVEASPAWRASFGSSYSEEEAAARLRLALAAPPAKRFAEAQVDGVTAGIGLGVSRDGKLGLFDIMVEPRFRQRGIAKQLLADLLVWGADSGAELAFLQVAAANDPAVALYRRLGFDVAYSYVYAGPELGSAADDSDD